MGVNRNVDKEDYGVARIRQIKPEFFLDDELALCPRDARLMFPGLWCLADRAGRLEDRPARIKVQLFPYDKDITADTIEGYLGRLGAHGFILRYKVGAKKIIQIRSFVKHQHCHVKEPESQLPPPPIVRRHKRDRANTGLEPGKNDSEMVQEPDEHRSSTSASGVLSIDNGGWSVGGGMGEGADPPPAASVSQQLRRNPPTQRRESAQEHNARVFQEIEAEERGGRS
jgi:hypothetical protein